MIALTGNRHVSLEAEALMNAGGFRVKPGSCLQGVLISSPPAVMRAFLFAGVGKVFIWIGAKTVPSLTSTSAEYVSKGELRDIPSGGVYRSHLSVANAPSIQVSAYPGRTVRDSRAFEWKADSMKHQHGRGLYISARRFRPGALGGRLVSRCPRKIRAYVLSVFRSAGQKEQDAVRKC